MQNRKIICPNDNRHIDHEKILLGYAELDGRPKRFFIHCDTIGCKTWYQLDFNLKGGAKIKIMPKDYKFNFLKTPVLVFESKNDYR